MPKLTLAPTLTPLDTPENVDWQGLQVTQPISTVATTRRPLSYLVPDALIARFPDLPPGLAITGLVLEFYCNRLDRVWDEYVGFTLDDQPVGRNMATEEPRSFGLYGAEDDAWGVDWTGIDYRDPAFAFKLQLIPHPLYPCRVEPWIRDLRFTFYY
jgi:hypothetical protein